MNFHSSKMEQKWNNCVAFCRVEKQKFYIKNFPHVKSYTIVKSYRKLNKVRAQSHAMNTMSVSLWAPQLLMEYSQKNLLS